MPLDKEVVDAPQIGFTVTKERPAKQFVFFNVGAGIHIDIAPNEANYKAPAQEAELTRDVEIVWLQMHAHVRAKQFTMRMLYPDGRVETALKVNWDPYWQTIYYPTETIHAPKGTRLHIEGTYDNSANNKYNPDPNAPVKFGDQYKDEMMFPTYGVLIDSSIDVIKNPVIKPAPGAAPAPDYTLKESPQTASR